MGKTNHIIDCFGINLSFENSDNAVSFGDILKHSALVNREIRIRGKDLEYNFLKETAEYVIGIMITGQHKSLPPKRDLTTKLYSALDVKPNEDLAYGNVLLYVKKYNILMYEFNKSGCYLEQFFEYIYKCWTTHEESETNLFNLKSSVVLRKSAYDRIIGFGKYKSLSIRILNPKELLRLYKEENDSIGNNIDHINNDIVKSFYDQIKLGADMGSTDWIVKVGTGREDQFGLHSGYINKIVSYLYNLIRKPSFKKHIEMVKVEGYSIDPDIRRAEPIDLITDALRTNIKLTEKRVNTDLNIVEREREIVSAYERLKAEFTTIFGY